MDRQISPGPRAPRFSPSVLLEFRPWMLAIAVFLACAIGVAVMEQVREARAMWAQAAEDGPAGR